jgi:two-component system, chemotaxis family, sensor kinase CheA
VNEVPEPKASLAEAASISGKPDHAFGGSDAAKARPDDLQFIFNAMLDTLGQGLFLFGADGICSPLFSQACLTLLEAAPAGRHIADVLSMDETAREDIGSLLNTLFSNVSKLVSYDDIFDLFPREFPHSKGLSVTLKYRAITDSSGALRSVVVIATNETEKVAALRQGLEREDKVQTILRISSNRNVFTHFYLAATGYFSSLEEALADYVSLEQVKRDIHTLKGNASLFHLHKFVSFLHDLESALGDAAAPPQARQILLPAIDRAGALLLEIKEEARKVLGDEFDRQGAIRSISLDQLKTFAEVLNQIGGFEDLKAHFVFTFMGEPVRKQLAPFAMALQELADRYGKNIGACEFAGEDFPILSERYQPLFDSFTHIVRNIVAHAAEEALMRAHYGKPSKLTVAVKTQKFRRDDRDWMRISFTDDGAGIDIAKLRSKLNITDAAVSNQEIMQSIFGDNFSTRDEVDELSGRGTGMGAIRECARRLGGNAYVESKPHIFTRVVVEVPLIWV